MIKPAYIVDASVALKWFLEKEAEPEAEEAEQLIGNFQLRTTSLCHFEVGNTLSRFAGGDPRRVTAALEELRTICGEPINLEPVDYLRCSTLAIEASITFYDASYVAIAERMGRNVISADRDLLEPGLAIGISAVLAES